LRVLHLSHGYPPAVGGSELVICAFSERLAARGHDVTVVTTTAYTTQAFREPGTPTMAPGEERRGGVLVRRHRADPRLAPRLRRAQALAHRFHVPGNGILRTLYDGPLAPGIVDDALHEPADVIGATAFPLLHMQVAVAAGRARGIPVALFGALHPDDRWGYDRGPIRLAIRAADAYCAYTAYERDHVAAIGVPARRLHVIPPGVDARAFAMADGSQVREALGIGRDEPVVGFLGQIGGHKGIEDLVEAMRTVWRSHPDAWLLIAGAETPHIEVVRARVAALPAARQARVRELLDVPAERKAHVLAAFDVFASPSGYESFGLTFLEAWAAGLPVVGCRAGAIPSVVRHGQTGLLVGYRQPAELAAALLELVASEPLRRRLAEAGRREAVERYSWERSTDRLEALYTDLAGG
jgi:glycosyltransferase involved in cell wall biosynthesis